MIEEFGAGNIVTGKYKDDDYSLDDLQMVFTEEALLDMSNEELLDIISITTLTHERIFFDSVESLNTEYIILNDGEKIAITTTSKYESLIAAYTRFKLFKVMHDPESKVSTYQKLQQKLEDQIEVRLTNVEMRLSNDLTKIRQSVENQTNHFTKKMDESTEKVALRLDARLDDAIKQLNHSANELSSTITKTIPEMKQQLSSIDTEGLNAVILHLKQVSTLLAEVVE